MIFTSPAHKRRFAITIACLLAFVGACFAFGPWFLLWSLIGVFGLLFVAFIVFGVWDCTSDNPGAGRGRMPPLRRPQR